MMDDEQKKLLRKRGASEIYIVLASFFDKNSKLFENHTYIMIRAALLIAASSFGAYWLINVGFPKAPFLLLPLIAYIIRPRDSKKYSFELVIIMALEWVFYLMLGLCLIRLITYPVDSDYDVMLLWLMFSSLLIVIFTSPCLARELKNEEPK